MYEGDTQKVKQKEQLLSPSQTTRIGRDAWRSQEPGWTNPEHAFLIGAKVCCLSMRW